MLKAEHVARTYGDETVLEGIDLEVRPGERLGLIGENGSGKSTLLRVLAGLEPPDAGRVSGGGRVALLVQDADTQARTVLEAVTPPELRRAQATWEAASAALGGGSAEALSGAAPSAAALEAFADAEERYRRLGGYEFAAWAAGVLAGLDLDPGAWAGELSGGQRRRVMLAALLLSPADVYLLDEPTNHLDLDGVRWLEGWIGGSEAAFVLASHDRAFLDAVTTRTAELERGRLHLYPGSYSEAAALRDTLREAQERSHAAYRRKRATLEEEQRRQASKGAVNENRRRAKDNDKFRSTFKAERHQQIHAARARAMEAQLGRLDAGAVDKPYDDRRRLRLDLPPVPPGPSEVLTVRGLTVRRDPDAAPGRPVLEGVDLQVRRGDRVALTGPNGGGKSTLLAALLGRLPHTGEVRWGGGLSLYVAGQHGEELGEAGTVADALLGANPLLTPHQLHEVAAQVWLPSPEAPVVSLSGGQRTRLSLARLGVTRSQVLVLDEPTNHLDLAMTLLLEDVLADFPGTVLLASHDRRLVAAVATREWRVGGGRVQEQAFTRGLPE
ncbi:ABC-F family ATP-binding cassette domain-containing protein [Deinococcus sp. Leaf326]|uniref:ABC-F family ATP-binding cassette domain-containing protein n=1 Tax=Deinococcus sp. Leaf326 TaxID=1736338 RepID=UPI0006F90C1A|nr:ABC-F family ATP-binding cassette domain-containing protein [Deinococcus sp. Leaf326]KQR04420.1 ABC transporter [Deinococcus sp. Leaf326]